jgi:hypothetical protein
VFKIPGVTKDSTPEQIVEAVNAHIKSLDKAGLATAREAALAEARTIGAPEDISDEDLAVLETLATFIGGADAEIAEQAAAETLRADRLAAARALLVEPEVVEPEVVEPQPDVTDEVVEIEPLLEPVAASGLTPKEKVSAVRRAAAAALPVDVEVTPRRGVATITAAADLPGVSLGSTFTSMRELREPTQRVLEALGRGTSGRNEKPIAQFNLQRDDDLYAEGDLSFQEALDRAADESRLPGGSLIAAGGWCAPSETIYDLCEGETLEGLWDIPSVNVSRGGLNFTKGPQFSDFYGQSSNFINQTEAQAIAGTAKPCVTITCPPFTDVRLGVTGLCFTVPILTEAAYPELVQRYLTGLTVAHAHYKSVDLITRALAIAGAAVAVANPWPTLSGSLLAALELVVNGERQRYRLGLNATLEAVLPFWIKAALRADLSIRTGVDYLSVTDQQVDAWFAERGIRAQYVYGWQPLVPTSSGAGVAIDYPTTLEVLVYPAGTFVQGTKDVITLNGVYDSVGLSTNVYTGLFTEEGISLMNMCYTPKRISLPMDITGLTAAAFVNQDFGAVPPKVIAASIPEL